MPWGHSIFATSFWGLTRLLTALPPTPLIDPVSRGKTHLAPMAASCFLSFPPRMRQIVCWYGKDSNWQSKRGGIWTRRPKEQGQAGPSRCPCHNLVGGLFVLSILSPPPLPVPCPLAYVTLSTYLLPLFYCTHDWPLYRVWRFHRSTILSYCSDAMVYGIWTVVRSASDVICIVHQRCLVLVCILFYLESMYDQYLCWLLL